MCLHGPQVHNQLSVGFDNRLIYSIRGDTIVSVLIEEEPMGDYQLWCLQ